MKNGLRPSGNKGSKSITKKIKTEIKTWRMTQFRQEVTSSGKIRERISSSVVGVEKYSKFSIITKVPVKGQI